MRLTTPLSAAALLTLALGTGIAAASPASALRPCYGPTPPDSCFSGPVAPAPTSLKASEVLQTRVTMTWVNNAGLRAAYRVVRTVNGAATTFPLPTAATSFTDTSAPAGTAITYAVYATACNVYDCTDSRPATLRVDTHPAPASPVGTGYGRSNYNYWLKKATSYTISGWTIDWDTTAPIQVVLEEDGVRVGGPVTAWGTSSTNATNPGYGDNHGYSLTKGLSLVKGRHAGCAKALNVAGGTDVVLGCYAYDTPGAPSAATNVSAVSNGSSVAVSFTDNANDETGFYLQRSTDGGATWLWVGQLQGSVAGSGSRATVTDYSSVAVGTCYRVVMRNTYGDVASAPGCTA